MNTPTPPSGTPAIPTAPKKFRRTSWVINKRLQYGMIATSGFFSLAALFTAYVFASYAFARLRNFAILYPSEGSRAFLRELDAVTEIFQISVAIGFFVFVILFTFVNLRLSNRIAGPVFHVMKSMRRARETGVLESVYLRSGDYFRELADEYNALVEQFGKPPEEPQKSETP